MGRTDVGDIENDEHRREFMRRLLRDVDALDIMLKRGLIETGIRRIGAEQEMAFVDQAGRPAPIGEVVLEGLPDEEYTTELGRFNLEINLDPQLFQGSALSDLEAQIVDRVQRAREVAKNHGALVALVGILPSISKTDLALENLTDRPRYHALNQILNEMRGGPYELNISGTDELTMTHDSIMLEACNTSFQVHFQVDPDHFAKWYNIAQLATAPVLAASVNSPVLLGRRLWRETRIAVFQQSIDTRHAQSGIRQLPARVSFGNDWIKESVLEIFQEDIARFKPIFHDLPDEDPLEVIAAGGVPELAALRLHNGTVYRWNRPCYGTHEGTAHLRIENRVLPAGPTPADEVANAALWLGLMKGLHDQYDDVREHIEFEQVVQSFLAAAREGLDSQLHWLNSQTLPAGALILSAIIPLARTGLESTNLDTADIDRYMGIIEQRVAKAQTGAAWALHALAMPEFTRHRRPFLGQLTSAMAERGAKNDPVHTWTPFTLDEYSDDSRHFETVGQFMITDLFTVLEDDVVDLVTNLMEWRHIRQIPVEDKHHALVGMVTHRDLLQHLRRLGSAIEGQDTGPVSVSEIMSRDPIHVDPETKTLEALKILQDNELSCLPVVENDRLVGLITEHDIMQIAAPLLKRFLES